MSSPRSNGSSNIINYMIDDTNEEVAAVEEVADTEVAE
jgi:hypothetical protein